MVFLAFLAGIFVGVVIGVILASVLSMLREKQVPGDLMPYRDNEAVHTPASGDSHEEVA